MLYLVVHYDWNQAVARPDRGEGGLQPGGGLQRRQEEEEVANKKKII